MKHSLVICEIESKDQSVNSKRMFVSVFLCNISNARKAANCQRMGSITENLGENKACADQRNWVVF